MKKEHQLKIAPEYFNAIVSEKKTFEIRKNDRDFKIGDRVILKEWVDENYTHQSIQAEISYVTDYEQKEGYVVFGLSNLHFYLITPVEKKNTKNANNHFNKKPYWKS